MKSFLSAKAQESLNRMIERFQAGETGSIVDVIKDRLSLPADAPYLRWSWGNQCLAFFQSGHLDCRGFRQWEQVGRHVSKGKHSDAFIFRVLTRRDVDDDGTEHFIPYAVTSISVFSYAQTEGDALEGYEPREVPPLMDVAQAWNLNVQWEPTVGCFGYYSELQGKIVVGTQDWKTWFHELCHAADARVHGDLRQQSKVVVEATAEMGATVLAELYGMGDRTGNLLEYVQMFSDDPLTAITECANRVGAVLDEILGYEKPERTSADVPE